MSGVTRQICLQVGGANIRTLSNLVAVSSVQPCTQTSKYTPNSSTRLTCHKVLGPSRDSYVIPCHERLRPSQNSNVISSQDSNGIPCQKGHQRCYSEETRQTCLKVQHKEQIFVQNAAEVVPECQVASREKYRRTLLQDRLRIDNVKHYPDYGQHLRQQMQPHTSQLYGCSKLLGSQVRVPQHPQQRPCHLKPKGPYQVDRHNTCMLPYHATHFCRPQPLSSQCYVPARSFKTSSYPNFVEINSASDFQGPTVSEMTTFLGKHKLGCSVGFTCLITPCPFCSENKATSAKGSQKESTTEGSVYINKTTGKYSEFHKNNTIHVILKF